MVLVLKRCNLLYGSAGGLLGDHPWPLRVFVLEHLLAS
jgi:hypothetical protein